MEGVNVAEGGAKFESDALTAANVGGGLPKGGGAENADPTPAQASSRGQSRGQSRRNKKVYKYVDLAAFQAAPPPPNTHVPTVTPAEFRSQTNGLPPMAIRNSEYAPVTGQGQNMHKTFGNMFQSMAATPRPKDYRKNEFAMRDDEFPSLK